MYSMDIELHPFTQNIWHNSKVYIFASFTHPLTNPISTLRQECGKGQHNGGRAHGTRQAETINQRSHGHPGTGTGQTGEAGDGSEPRAGLRRVQHRGHERPVLRGDELDVALAEHEERSNQQGGDTYVAVTKEAESEGSFKALQMVDQRGGNPERCGTVQRRPTQSGARTEPLQRSAVSQQ